MNFIEKEKLATNTLIIISSDHRHWGGASTAGKIFFAMSHPDHRKPKIITQVGFSADIPATILETILKKPTSLNLGKSIFSHRKQYPHLVSIV